MLWISLSFTRERARTPKRAMKRITLHWSLHMHIAHCTLHVCVNKSMQAMNRIVIYFFFQATRNGKTLIVNALSNPKHTHGEHFLCVWHIFSILIACHKFQQKKNTEKLSIEPFTSESTTLEWNGAMSRETKKSKTKTRMNKSMERSLTVIHLIWLIC